MDGKLLILCDEIPRVYDGYSVKDIYYLRAEMIDPDDNPDRLFVCWDAIIPQDHSFIEKCMHYAATYEKIPPDFMLKQTGMTDGKHGSIKGSIQEDSYIRVLNHNIESIRACANRGEDYRAEALDLAVQYPMQATQQFFEDFSSILNLNGVVRILVAHKDTTPSNVINDRMRLLDAWQNQNRFMREKAAYAELVEPMMYDDFGKVYSRSLDEMMKIYSLPIFGEMKDKGRKKV